MKHYYNNGIVCKKFDPEVDVIPEGFVKGRLCFSLQTDSFKEKISSSVKKLWDDPEYRRRQSISHKHPVSKVVEKITVTDDVINMKISIKASIPKGFHIGKSEVDQSLIASLTKKEHGTTGKISVTKNGCDRFIYKEDLQLYLDAGYVKGGKSKKELRDYDHVWNKGLTKNSDDRVKKMSEKLKTNNSVLGPNSQEIKKKISNTVKQRWKEGCFVSTVEANKGRTPWNKGLTASVDSRLKRDPEATKKAFITRKNNGTLNTSEPEELFYKELQKLFDIEDIERNYVDVRYPWHCDFYIKSIDLFIELNLFPTHGSAPYDETNDEDIKKLQELKTSPKNWIDEQQVNIWAGSDVVKRKTALQNNLNYLCIYNGECNELSELCGKINRCIGNGQK